MSDLVGDPKHDLFAPIPHGDGQTLLREALLVADHNAYHLGQIGAAPPYIGTEVGAILARDRDCLPPK